MERKALQEIMDFTDDLWSKGKVTDEAHLAIHETLDKLAVDLVVSKDDLDDMAKARDIIK